MTLVQMVRINTGTEDCNGLYFAGGCIFEDINEAELK